MSSHSSANQADVRVQSEQDPRKESQDVDHKNPYQPEMRMSHASSSPESREPVEEDPRRRSFEIAAIVLSFFILITTLGTVATAAVVFGKLNNSNEEAVSHMVAYILYIISLVEAAMTLVTMIPIIVLLFCRPRSVLIRDRHNGGFVCLCVTIFLLAIFAIYSFVAPIVVQNDKPNVSAAVCIVPGFRFLAMFALFGVLVANSKL